MNQQRFQDLYNIRSMTTAMTTNVDNRLVAIASSITTLKTEIKNLIVQAVGTNPNGGCGTTTGLCDTYSGGISSCLSGYEELDDDLFQVRVQNMSSRSYFGIEPAQHSTSTLSSSNVGIGSFNILTKDGGSGIGFTVTISSSGRTCATYYNQVTSKFGEIDTLRSEVSMNSFLPSTSLNENDQRYRCNDGGTCGKIMNLLTIMHN